MNVEQLMLMASRKSPVSP